MTFHFMPGLWMEDWGLEITESILIREAGPGRMPLRPPPQALREGLSRWTDLTAPWGCWAI
jgi:hypothetical protein